jgi:flagellar biosynthesis protein FlhG
MWLLVNNAQTEEEAEETITQLQAATQRFLGKELNVLGMIPNDPHILQSVRQQRGVVELYPRSASANAFRSIASHLRQNVSLHRDSFDSFWKQLRTEVP